MAEREVPTEYLRAGDVARMLHVSPKTVARWAAEGKLPYVRTLGGHRRFAAPVMNELVRRLALAGGDGAKTEEALKAVAGL